MLRIIFGLFLFMTFSTHSTASAACKVYGISDSPQKLNCQFPAEEIKLRCRSGKYFLNGTKVTVAFHYDVEEGDTPLVFRSPDMELIVTGTAAELAREKGSVHGTCR